MLKITGNTFHKNNSGQALLFVVVALAISMVVGVSISTRTLSLSRRVSNTDTHSRVYYSAEAGIERFVSLPMDELAAIAANTDCGTTGSTQDDAGNCTFDLGDDIETSTQVTVESLTYNESSPSNHYSVELKNGSSAAVNINNATSSLLRICWKSQASDPVAIYYTVWFSNGIRDKKILIPDSAAQPMPSITGGTVGAIASGSYSAYYNFCYSGISISGAGKVSLNVAALGSNTKVGVFPQNGSLPPQGYRITSKARLKSDDTNQVQVTKVIEVVRSYDFVPGFFDNALYAQGWIMED